MAVASLAVATMAKSLKKLAAKKVAPVVDSSSDVSDVYLSSKESDAKLLVSLQPNGGLSKYKQLRAHNIAGNNAQLAMLGLDNKPYEAKRFGR